MKLDHELLHRLVMTRMHLAGTGSPPVDLPDRERKTTYYSLAADGAGLVVDTVLGSAEIVAGEGFMVGRVPDISDPNQFEVALQNIDGEMARGDPRYTTALATFADALVLSSDTNLKGSVDFLIEDDTVERAAEGKAFTSALVDLVRFDGYVAEAGLSDLGWEVLTTLPGDFDPRIVASKRAELMKEILAEMEASAPGM